MLGLIFIRVTQHHQKLVSTYSHYCFLSAHMSHEEARHLHQHCVAFRVTIPVVVLLEVIDVEINAPLLAPGLCLALARDGIEIATVVTASERVADAQLEKLRLQLFPMRDVNENSVAVFLSAFRIDRQKCAIDDGSRHSVAARKLKFDISHRSFALELRHLPRPNFRPHEVTGAISLQIFERLDAEHLQ